MQEKIYLLIIPVKLKHINKIYTDLKKILVYIDGNTDYFINPNLLLRMELRGLFSSSNTFQSGVGSMKNNRFFATSLAYKF